MSPLYLYPALLKKLGKGGGSGSGKSSDAINYIFRNGERLSTPENPNTTSNVFWKAFATPCYRIPSMVITDTGRIIVGADYRSLPEDITAILPCLAYSDDNGETWNKFIPKIKDGGNWLWPSDGWWLNNKYRIMDQTMFYYKGVVHIICGFWDGYDNNANWTQTQNDRSWNVAHIWSEDNGTSWKLDLNFKNKVTGFQAGHSWLGGVGKAITTKYGTCVVPIQVSTSRGTVSAGFIYSNDGVNWKRSTNVLSGCSETSITGWIDSSGRQEIHLWSRRDPNTGNSKSCVFTYQTDANNFNQTFTNYDRYNNKIPARGPNGCQGTSISPFNQDGNLSPRFNCMVSYANNFLNNINGYIRDSIVVGAFPSDNFSGSKDYLREFEKITGVNQTSFTNNIPYGGYSCLDYNHKAKKLGIAYESNLGIAYKDLSHLIPMFLYESAK